MEKEPVTPSLSRIQRLRDELDQLENEIENGLDPAPTGKAAEAVPQSQGTDVPLVGLVALLFLMVIYLVLRPAPLPEKEISFLKEKLAAQTNSYEQTITNLSAELKSTQAALLETQKALRQSQEEFLSLQHPMRQPDPPSPTPDQALVGQKEPSAGTEPVALTPPPPSSRVIDSSPRPVPLAVKQPSGPSAEELAKQENERQLQQIELAKQESLRLEKAAEQALKQGIIERIAENWNEIQRVRNERANTWQSLEDNVNALEATQREINRVRGSAVGQTEPSSDESSQNRASNEIPEREAGQSGYLGDAPDFVELPSLPMVKILKEAKLSSRILEEEQTLLSKTQEQLVRKIESLLAAQAELKSVLTLPPNSPSPEP